LVIPLHTITVKVDQDLKRKMGVVRINWSEHIRDAIRRRIEFEERRRATERLLEGLKTGSPLLRRGS